VNLAFAVDNADKSLLKMISELSNYVNNRFNNLSNAVIADLNNLDKKMMGKENVKIYSLQAQLDSVKGEWKKLIEGNKKILDKINSVSDFLSSLHSKFYSDLEKSIKKIHQKYEIDDYLVQNNLCQKSHYRT
jgi:uncharacterized protein YoxC